MTLFACTLCEWLGCCHLSILTTSPFRNHPGIFQCGPASLTAIKEGDVNKDYDCPFVFAEVNADRVTWLYTSTGEKQRLHSETKSIGQFTSTKAVGSNARVDVTSNYKYAEGKAREAMMLAHPTVSWARFCKTTAKARVSMGA